MSSIVNPINLSEITEVSEFGIKVGQRIKNLHEFNTVRFEDQNHILDADEIISRINEPLQLEEYAVADENRKIAQKLIKEGEEPDRFKQIRPFHSLGILFAGKDLEFMPYLTEFCNLYSNNGHSMKLSDRGLSQIKTGGQFDNLFMVGQVQDDTDFENRKIVVNSMLSSKLSTSFIISNDYVDLHNAMTSKHIQESSKNIILVRFSKFFNSGNCINQLKQNGTISADFLIGAEGAWNNDAEHYEAKRLSTKCKTVFISNKKFRIEPKQTIDTVFKMMDKIHDDNLKIIAREKLNKKGRKVIKFFDHDYNTENIPKLMISIDPKVFKNDHDKKWACYFLEKISDSSLKPCFIHFLDDDNDSLKNEILQSAVSGILTRKRIVGDIYRKHTIENNDFDSFFPSYKNVDVKFELKQ